MQVTYGYHKGGTSRLINIAAIEVTLHRRGDHLFGPNPEKLGFWGLKRLRLYGFGLGFMGFEFGFKCFGLDFRVSG